MMMIGLKMVVNGDDDDYDDHDNFYTNDRADRLNARLHMPL